MFCTNCGKQLEEGSKFCPGCGTPVAQGYQDPSGHPSAEERPTVQEQQHAPDTLETVIGRNAAYYLREFEKADAGEKTKFNWAAFFFGPFFCIYRKCGGLFKKYFLLPVILLAASGIVTAIGIAVFSFGAMLAGSILSAAASLWIFFSCILLGKKFNAIYAVRCRSVLSAGTQNKYGTSPGGAALFAVLVAAVAGILAMTAVVGMANSLTEDQETSGTAYSTLLDGEYAVVFGETPEDGYIYMSFNWNGPGTLRFYFSDDPTDVLEASYTVSPTDTEGVYSLSVSIEELGSRELFTFYSLDEAGQFAVSFSDWLTEGADVSSVMVPFTEQYGFYGGGRDADSSGIAGDLPTWCSGRYYGADLYSDITFTGAGEFEIFIYNLVDIEHCVVTSQTENEVTFTGDFDIDVGSMSGTLTSYDRSSLTLTVLSSDWDGLTAGTMLEFYYDYPDENYSANIQSAASEICGIYASMDVVTTRLFVWENGDNLYLSIQNHGNPLGIVEVAPFEMEWISDVLYFSGATIGSEEWISGSYDPTDQTISLQLEDDNSTLSAYGVGGIFAWQGL